MMDGPNGNEPSPAEELSDNDQGPSSLRANTGDIPYDTEDSCSTSGERHRGHHSVLEYYDETTSFSEQLSQQGNSLIFSFNFGEQVARKTRENIAASLRRSGLLETTVTSPRVDDVPKKGLVHETPSSENGGADASQAHAQLPSTSKGDRKRPLNKNERENDSVPLPQLEWSDSRQLWQNMVYREEAAARLRTCRLFEDPGSGLTRMRAILLDWLMEVCEVYALRRATYYLTVDYVDRYLTINPTVPRTKLQLIGITALFIAAKFEEIFPPKLFEFAYVCDGACTEAHILKCEMLLLNSFGWDVNTTTVINWFCLFLQIYTTRETTENVENMSPNALHFTETRYSQYDFVRGAQIIDLFSLDPGFLYFSYRVIAACAVYFLYGKTEALSVSNLKWEDIEDCISYMSIFYVAVRDTDDPRLHYISQAAGEETDSPDSRDGSPVVKKRHAIHITRKERHLLQTHVINLYLFERVTIKRLQQLGFEVRKLFVKKPRSGDDTDMEEVSVDESDSDDEEGTIRMTMFEITRTDEEDEQSATTSTTASATPSCSDESKNYFKPNTKYSFDDVHYGIYTFMKKSLLSRRLSQQQVFED